MPIRSPIMINEMITLFVVSIATLSLNKAGSAINPAWSFGLGSNQQRRSYKRSSQACLEIRLRTGSRSQNPTTGGICSRTRSGSDYKFSLLGQQAYLGTIGSLLVPFIIMLLVSQFALGFSCSVLKGYIVLFDSFYTNYRMILQWRRW